MKSRFSMESTQDERKDLDRVLRGYRAFAPTGPLLIGTHWIHLDALRFEEGSAALTYEDIARWTICLRYA